MTPLNIALCYESVLPNKGGAETYLGDLARRLAKDGHEVHLYASRWDASALPPQTRFHHVPPVRGPRFLRPWRFGMACEAALKQNHHDVSLGFDKTWGQDILYPQGGLHLAAKDHNLLKFRDPIVRFLAASGKFLDPAARSFARLEAKQYLREPRPTIIVNSHMVARHFQKYYRIHPENLHVVPSAIDPARLAHPDRDAVRREIRQRWGVPSSEPVGLMVAMNYRLKGLAPLLRAIVAVPPQHQFRVAIVGHPNYDRYQRLARRLGIEHRCLFLGFQADPKTSFFAADFLVHPTFYDPCSLVVLEALACGLPVITTPYNGAAELYQTPEEGLLIQNPHDSLEFAAVLAKMLNTDYRRRAAEAAARAGTRWTFEHHYQRLVSIMDEVRSQKAWGRE